MKKKRRGSAIFIRFDSSRFAEERERERETKVFYFVIFSLFSFFAFFYAITHSRDPYKSLALFTSEDRHQYTIPTRAL